MKVSSNIRNKANEIIAKYNGYKTPKEIATMYDELELIGIEIPLFTSDRKAHNFLYNGEIVDNSLFVYSVYELSNSDKNEYTMYLS